MGCGGLIRLLTLGITLIGTICVSTEEILEAQPVTSGPDAGFPPTVSVSCKPVVCGEPKYHHSVATHHSVYVVIRVVSSCDNPRLAGARRSRAGAESD
jgi:hypothetical protein